MNNQILDDDFPLLEYQGDCLTEADLTDFFNQKYDSLSASEINGHLNYCFACQALAKQLISQIHQEAVAKACEQKGQGK